MNKSVKVEIKNQEGKLVVSSCDVAKGLHKEHKDVKRKIREILTVGKFPEREFITEKGNKYTEYLLEKTHLFF